MVIVGVGGAAMIVVGVGEGGTMVIVGNGGGAMIAVGVGGDENRQPANAISPPPITPMVLSQVLPIENGSDT
jgi:hypothetical protein